jgi:hypothetical protein
MKHASQAESQDNEAGFQVLYLSLGNIFITKTSAAEGVESVQQGKEYPHYKSDSLILGGMHRELH